MGDQETQPKLAYIDIETTGLDSVRHEMYEISLAKAGPIEGSAQELYYWIEPQSLELASAEALKIGGYHKRKPDMSDIVTTDSERRGVAEAIALFTTDCHLVGANPSFDAGFIQRFLWDNGQIPLWHHRMVDIESMIIGLAPERSEGRPMGVKDLLKYFEAQIAISPEFRHTAKGDRVAVEKIYAEIVVRGNHAGRAVGV